MKNNKETKGELVYGLHPLVEIIKAKKRKVISIYTTKPEPKGWEIINKVMPKYPVPIQYVTRTVLSRMVETTDHQGFVAWVQPLPMRKKFFEPSTHPFIVLLDGIQDPRNLGAIIRSAYCTKADGVIITQKNSCPFNATALKASAGLAEYIDIYLTPSVESATQALKKAGYTLYLAGFGGQNATSVAYHSPLCLVIGGEGFGISKSLYSQGTLITLPQRATDLSYNASVAAGILLFFISGKIKNL